MGSFKSKRSFLLFATLILLAAYAWLAFNWSCEEGEGFIICPFRRITTLPCPGCGLTTSILLLLKGEFLQALSMNPLGIIALPVLVFAPLFLLFRSDKCYNLWNSAEVSASKGRVALILVVVIALVWLYLIIHSLYVR